jgi:hypothetical protein
MFLRHFTTLRHDVAADSRCAPPSPMTLEGGAVRLCSAFARMAATCVVIAGCASDAARSNANHIAGAPAAESGTGGGSPMQLAAGSAAGQSGGGAAGGKLSFATDVYDAVIRARCAACHSDAPSFGGLAFFPGAAMAYASLVAVPAGPAEANLCRDSGLLRVQPGDPERSLLFLKLTQPPCGSKMPPAVYPQATEAQVSLVRQWIADGAAP